MILSEVRLRVRREISLVNRVPNLFIIIIIIRIECHMEVKYYALKLFPFLYDSNANHHMLVR